VIDDSVLYSVVLLLLLQELADDEATKRASSNDGEVLVSRHVLAIWGNPYFATL